MKAPPDTKLRRNKRHAVRRSVLAAFTAHSVFVGAVLLVDSISSAITLRNLHEQIVDRHAFNAWWWLQDRFPREIGTVVYPIARLIGLDRTSFLIWLIWYLTVGALPYVLLVAIIAASREPRQKLRLNDGVPNDTDAKRDAASG
ncbi:MAG: hypothetical protein ACTHQM_26110 [Thermoanaerobaculia bacterium]